MDLSTYNVENLSSLVRTIEKTGIPRFTLRISEIWKVLRSSYSNTLQFWEYAMFVMKSLVLWNSNNRAGANLYEADMV